MVKNPSEFQKLLVKFQQQQTEAGLEKRERFHKNLIKVSFFFILPFPRRHEKKISKYEELTREIILRSRPELDPDIYSEWETETKISGLEIKCFRISFLKAAKR
ncbi:hypothetical protein CEXT_20891 [Caerostris extrusa]|uniref:Uncharacterized protein n=1 Tax=Caerostris extrusa TaxID=172846 RepID=A0AAV4RDG8_CAEEX|nr:hypothetical protein CEXT_20891 [Caerostris extrusa]